EPQNKKPPRYTATEIGTLGGTFSQAGGLNSRGAVAGTATTLGEQTARAFLWWRGRMDELGIPGGSNSFTSEDYPVNDSDVVTGYSETSTPDPNGEDVCGLGTHLICLPFAWQKGEMTALPLLGGTNGLAAGINKRGQIAGTSETANPDSTCSLFFLQIEAVVWEGGH